MIWRSAAVVFGLLIGVAVPLSQAGAQYYPYGAPPYGPPAYGPPPYGPPSYRLPPVAVEDETQPSAPVPRDYRAAPAPNGMPQQDPYAAPRDYRQAAPGPTGEPYPYGTVEAHPYGGPYGPPGAINPYEEQRPVPGGTGSPPPYGAPPYDASPSYPRPPTDVGQRPPDAIGQQEIASLPLDYRPEAGSPKQLAPQFVRQLVDYRTKEPAGTIVIDTPHTFLYLVLGNGQAMRYGIGVGREGFTWSGIERITRMQEWPDWNPPPEMIERQPYLPRFMAGGPSNPLGARALYLGKTIYRIHGTNQPSTIGQFVSSGCIRLVNEDVEDLYGRVNVGTRVVVLPGGKPPATASAAPTPH
jgi:lipoprotein-anchoring transpeptidase ErfK/SrfK